MGKDRNDKVRLILDEEVPAGRFGKEEEDFSKKRIFAEEAMEFLRIIFFFFHLIIHKNVNT